MIKTYRYNELCNNVSLTLSGASGNSMRYNFTHGNTYMRKCPELTLRNKYAQDLLDSHELVKSGKVTCIRTTLEESDIVQEEQPVNEPVNDSESKTPKVVDGVEIVEEVHTADEAVTYVNQRWNKQFIRPTKAIEFATKENVHFPNCNQV